MKILMMILLSLSVQAVTLEGSNYEGGTCTLTIEDISFENGEQDLAHVRMKVRSSWQLEQNPSLVTTLSPTPWVLYAKNKETYDQIAITLTHGSFNPKDIVSYSFQTWDQERGRLQKGCRF